MRLRTALIFFCTLKQIHIDIGVQNALCVCARDDAAAMAACNVRKIKRNFYDNISCRARRAKRNTAPLIHKLHLLLSEVCGGRRRGDLRWRRHSGFLFIYIIKSLRCREYFPHTILCPCVSSFLPTPAPIHKRQRPHGVERI